MSDPLFPHKGPFVYVTGSATFNDYGDITGCSPDAVYGSLDRAKRAIEEHLKGRYRDKQNFSMNWRPDVDDEDILIGNPAYEEQRAIPAYVEHRGALLVQHAATSETVMVEGYDHEMIVKVALEGPYELVETEELT